MNSYISHNYEFILILTPIPFVNLTISCGLPCEHVLKITNELTHEMIHVQNWKIFASHYNDDSTDLGFELKKAQLHFKQYGEQMGVPVRDEMVCRAKRPSVDDNFPYMFDGTSQTDYNEAKWVETNNNCITIREWHERVAILKKASVASVLTTSQPKNSVDHSISKNTACFLTGSADCDNDLYDQTNNNESISDILNDIDSKLPVHDSPMKQKKLFDYETPTKEVNELLRFKDKHTFLSPTTKELQRSIEKAACSTKMIYNSNDLILTRKNILHDVDHILKHDLVKENTQAAAFVYELEKKVQAIKEEFTKTVHSIIGTLNGNDDELTFPAFQSRKRKKVDKRYKGLSG